MPRHDLLPEARGWLLPGEEKSHQQLKIREYKKIVERIEDLEQTIRSNQDMSRTLKTNPEILQQLAQIRKRVARKVELLDRAKRKRDQINQRIFDILDSDCSDFVKDMKKARLVLYRGTRNDASVFEAHTMEDRRPKDSNAEVTELYDQMMSALGVKALRSNSIFTTTNYGFAANYGRDVYMIFPKNGFDFLSTDVKDLILDKKYQLANQEAIKRFCLAVKEYGQANVPNWENTPLAKNINWPDWEHSLRVLELNFQGGNRMNLPEKFRVNIEDFVSPASVKDAFKPNTTDLVPALVSGKEMLIRGEYWALKKRDWHDLVSEHYFDWNLSN